MSNLIKYVNKFQRNQEERGLQNQWWGLNSTEKPNPGITNNKPRGKGNKEKGESKDKGATFKGDEPRRRNKIIPKPLLAIVGY